MISRSAVLQFSFRDGQTNILVINDLVDNNGDLLTLRKFIETYDINTNFLEFEGLMSAVRDYVDKFRFQHFPQKSQNPVCPLLISGLVKDKKGCRSMYDIFLKNKVKPTSLDKRQNEILYFANVNWQKVFHLPYQVAKETKLIWFQSRLTHRILGTNHLLSKMSIVVHFAMKMWKQLNIYFLIVM